MKKEIYVRMGVGDLLLTKEDAEKLTSKYVVIKDVGEVELYHVGYEDEEGNEVDEDGNEL